MKPCIEDGDTSMTSFGDYYQQLAFRNTSPHWSHALCNTLSSSSVCLDLASSGERSPPPGFLMLCFIASPRLSAAFYVSLSDSMSPTFLSFCFVVVVFTLPEFIPFPFISYLPPLSPTFYLQCPSAPDLLALIAIGLT